VLLLLLGMGKGASSSKASALFVSTPVLGILFLSVPWEVDPRAEASEKRIERLLSPHRPALLDVLVSLYNEFNHNNKWDGLFTWQRKELRELRIEEDLARNGGVNFLKQAIVEDDYDGLMSLLRRGADPNNADAEGRRPLRLMVERCGAEESRRSYEESCRHGCSSYAQELMVKDRVADIGRSRFFEALISHGARVEFMVSVNEIKPGSLSSTAAPTAPMTLLEYARLRCPVEVVNVIAKGKRERPNQ
jgi:hypothetical protein